MTEEDLEKMAMNTINFTDEIVYRGFIDALSEDEEYDFGAERWCMIAPLGEYLATTADGREVTEILAPEDFERIVMLFHDRQQEKGGVPLDRDHASMKKPLDRDTQAYGWIRDLRMMIGGASQFNGLYAKIEWTDEGRSLVLNKAYRFLSPVFTMDGEGHPTSLVNVALTNRPNFDLPPIFNSAVENNSDVVENNMAGDDSVNTIVEEHSMDIEQLKNDIASKVVEELKVVLADAKPMVVNSDVDALNADCGTVSAKAETKEVKNEDSEDVSEKKETDEKTETDDKTEVETTEEKKNEDVSAKDVSANAETAETDVITEDVLNTVPTEITPDTNTLHQAAEWQNLHGEALIEWARKNPQCV